MALASSADGTGALAEARVTAAFSTRYLAVGLGVGGQLQRFGRNGLSHRADAAARAARDGLNLFVEYAYSVAPNQYTGQRTIGFSNIVGTLRIPLTERLALQIDGGLNLQAWAFTTVGLRHRLRGDGGPGTWFVSARPGRRLGQPAVGLQLRGGRPRAAPRRCPSGRPSASGSNAGSEAARCAWCRPASGSRARPARRRRAAPPRTARAGRAPRSPA